MRCRALVLPFAMTSDQETNIVLRLPRADKGRYVAAAREQGLTLAAWIFARLDAASAHISFPDKQVLTRTDEEKPTAHTGKP